MRTQKRISLFRLVLPIGIVIGPFCAQAFAQTPAPSPEPGKTTVKTTVATSVPVILENKSGAPQVVTILHSLNGLKVFRLLMRSEAELNAIAGVDEDFSF